MFPPTTASYLQRFCCRAGGAWPIATTKPDGYQGLRATISPIEDAEGYPVGFRVEIQGSVNVKFYVPPILGRLDLGKNMTMNLAAETFTWHRNEVSSAWKDGHYLATRGALHGTPRGGAKNRREATSRALMERPLAFRLSLMRGDKSNEIGLFIVAASYRSQSLNENSASLDKDDIVRITAPEVCRFGGAVLRMDPCDEQRDAAWSKLLGETLLASCPPSSDPGMEMMSIRDAFIRNLAGLNASFPKRRKKSPASRIRGHSRRGRSQSRRPARSKSPASKGTDQPTAGTSGNDVANDTAQGPPLPAPGPEGNPPLPEDDPQGEPAGDQSDDDDGSQGEDSDDSGVDDPHSNVMLANPGRNKYRHILSPLWFQVSSSKDFKRFFSRSITASTARQYTPHVGRWVSYCENKGIVPYEPSVGQVLEFLAEKAGSGTPGSVSMCVAAIKKFIEANLREAKVVDHPALRTLVKGVHNLPHTRKYKRYRLVTCQEAFKLTGHIVYHLPEGKFTPADKETIWCLVLICQYYSLRVGDLCSERVNTVTAKALLWKHVYWTVPGEKATIFVDNPKKSVNNKGYPIFLVKNTENPAFCPIAFLGKLSMRQHTPESPVFRYSTGKCIVGSHISDIMEKVNAQIGIPSDATLSKHSFRAAMPSAIALNPQEFLPQDTRAAGRWRSNAADRYVRAGQKPAERLVEKAYRYV